MYVREVREVTVTYADGSTETFQTPHGAHRIASNNVASDTTPEMKWVEHEVRWNTRQPHQVNTVRK